MWSDKLKQTGLGKSGAAGQRFQGAVERQSIGVSYGICCRFRRMSYYCELCYFSTICLEVVKVWSRD